MISLFVPIRNAAESARQCLISLSASCQSLRIVDRVEYILLDDASEPQYEIPKLMLDFRKETQSKVTILRFPVRRNYTSACAVGFSVAAGSEVILISHDMLVTPSFLRTILAVAASDPALGIIRGRSQHMDCSPHSLAPEKPIRTFENVIAFSAQAADAFGLAVVDTVSLIGDSLLIQRPVLDKIGVMDQRFVGFLGDFDLGIRARRAGFRTVESMGAWLHHSGCGTINAELTAGREKPEEVAQGLPMLDAAYEVLRAKWSVAPLPATFREFTAAHFPILQAAPPSSADDFLAPIALDPEFCEILGN
ncbi:MAG: glycosyltransferase [Tepidisphaeraceae bacterium]